MLLDTLCNAFLPLLGACLAGSETTVLFAIYISVNHKKSVRFIKIK